ncbi:MAG: 3-deoxy-manno-octulosonate cytidylyltransferase [Thermodesulfovibrionia bacterium]|nr:3-deoxy-manno-octulosonate cytidylyltransferase [Thermodesulfovibrionia bacterium]
MQKVVAIVPARFNATRFPGKPLALLNGKPIIQHVYEQTVRAGLVSKTYVATDDKRIYDTVTGFGGEALMTSGTHATGTDRVAEAAAGLECDIVVNVQGDEPFIRPVMIDSLVEMMLKDSRASIGTLAKKITDIQEVLSPHVVKVVMDDDGFALYFSRSPIPYHRDEWAGLDSIRMSGSISIYKHIGIYAFKKTDLFKFTGLGESSIEMIERLEQLRALNSGMKIKVKETIYDTLGIDTADDLKRAEEWLRQNISL